MVAAPETKNDSDVIASKEVENAQPTAEELKKTQKDSAMDSEEVPLSAATGSKDVTADPDMRYALFPQRSYLQCVHHLL